jgi:hypothetical protein
VAPGMSLYGLKVSLMAPGMSHHVTSSRVILVAFDEAQYSNNPFLIILIIAKMSFFEK